MEIMSISSRLAAEHGCVLPLYKFSTIRGCLGHGLRKVICIKSKSECSDCSVIKHCPYVLMFDNTITQSEFLPFVSYSANTSKSFIEGDELDVRLTLLGSAAKYASYAVLALQEVCAGGIGAERAKFKVTDEPVLELKELTFREHAAGVYRIHILSPLRAKQGSRLAKSVSLEKIISLAKHRIEMLYSFSKESIPEDFPDNFSFQEISCETRWIDIERYSNRQSTKMSLGGFVGFMDYEDKNGATAALIDFAANLHIGKQTTFGYGKIYQEKIR